MSARDSAPALACAICGPVSSGVRLFQITVDGTPLRVGLYLCDDHGDAYLLRVGKAIGEFLRDEPKREST